MLNEVGNLHFVIIYVYNGEMMAGCCINLSSDVWGYLFWLFPLKEATVLFGVFSFCQRNSSSGFS